MTVYYSLFAITLVASYFGLAKDFPRRMAAAMLFMAMAFLITLAYATTDYFSYQEIYHRITDYRRISLLGYPVSVVTRVEPAFALLVLLEKSLTGNFAVFWFIFTALSMLVKVYAFNKLSPYLILTILVYLGDVYFWKDLSGIRGSMASGLVLLSLIYVDRRQPLLFLLVLLAALSFHFAAIVAAPLYWAKSLGRRWILASVFVLSIAVAAAGGVGLMLPEIAAGLGFDEASRIIKYVDSRYAVGIRAFGGTFMIHVVIVTLLLSLYHPLVRTWRFNEILIPVYVYGTVLMFVFIDYGIIAGRIRETLCIPVGAVLLPSFVLLLRGHQRLIPYCAVVGYAALWFFLMMRDRLPYQNILFANL
jgi:hypothetical protein